MGHHWTDYYTDEELQRRDERIAKERREREAKVVAQKIGEYFLDHPHLWRKLVNILENERSKSQMSNN